MVNHAHHRWKIRAKAIAVHVALLPLAAGVPLLWIYFALGYCQDADTGVETTLCGLSRAIPMLPAVLGAVAAGLIYWDLVSLGRALHEDAGGHRRDKSHWGHAAHGLRNLDDAHRRHVHLVWIQAAIALAAVAAWLAFAYRSTH